MSDGVTESELPNAIGRERESLSVETRLQLSAVSSTVSLSHCESV